MTKLANLKEGQHSDENGPFEVFWADRLRRDFMGEGWYWWSCSPGCLPDGDPQGPYATSQEAWQAATDLDMGHGLPGGPCDIEELKNLEHERQCSERMESGDY